jgi:SAM-dependent methyltransferase
VTAVPTVDPALRDGHYAAKQLFSSDRLVSWSHRRRFETGLRLARRFHGQRIVDYGCGDGTFLALLSASATPPLEAIGAELDERQVHDCRARLGDRPGLKFELISTLEDEPHRGRYDGVVCMEVLEHVVAVDRVIECFHRLLREDGVLLVSVPVEIGIALLVKQAARRIAGWRGIGDYPGTAPYTLAECWASVFAGRSQHIARPVYGVEAGRPFYDHKGFNWMALRDRLARRFHLGDVVASPLPRLGPRFATQVWFSATKKRVP